MKKMMIRGLAATVLMVAGTAFGQAQPTRVLCFNSRIENDPAQRGFNAAAKGWIFSQMGFLGPQGQPPTVNAAGQVVNSAGDVVGSVIRNGAGVAVGYRSADGTKEAYDLDSGFTANDAWNRVAAGGNLTIAKHGITYEDAAGTITGTGITLDGGRPYPGFGPAGGGGGTGAPGTPYPLDPRPGAGISVYLNGCYTGLDADGAGPGTSVGGSISGVPGVAPGGVTTNPGMIYKGGFGVEAADQPTADLAAAALARCAAAAGFHTKNPDGSRGEPDVGGWLSSMSFEDAYAAGQACITNAGVAATLTFQREKATTAEGACTPGGGTFGIECPYYENLEMVGALPGTGSRIRFQPSPLHYGVEVFYPPFSVPQQVPIQIQPLSLQSVFPPGLEPYMPVVSIHSYTGQPYNHQPAQVQLFFPTMPEPPVGLFRLVGGQWQPMTGFISPGGVAQFQIQGPIIVGLFGPMHQPPCPADYNGDGGIDGDDVIAFFQDWDQGLAAADYTGDGGVDGDDVIAFFEDWDTQCGG